MRASLVAFILSAGLFAGFFAGCLDDSDGGLVTARAAYPTARAEARDWQEDAVMVGAMTYEIGPELLADVAEELAEAEQELDADHAECMQDGGDAAQCQAERNEAEAELLVLRAMVAAGADRVGDGRAAVWAFSFRSEAADAALVVFTSARKVLLSDEDDNMDFGLTDGSPLAEWPIDSDEAASAAREASPEFSSRAASPTAAAYSLLVQGPNQPYWVLGVEDDAMDDGGDDVVVAVDAVNGTIVPVGEVLSAFLPILQEAGVGSGTLTAVTDPDATMPFEVEMAGHEAAVVYVEISPPPLGPLEVVVTGPAGDSVAEFTVPARAGTRSTGYAVFEDVPAGGYSVTLSLGLGARHSWQASWCTDGIPFGFTVGSGGSPYASPACPFVPETPDGAAAETVSRWFGLAGL